MHTVSSLGIWTCTASDDERASHYHYVVVPLSISLPPRRDDYWGTANVGRASTPAAGLQTRSRFSFAARRDVGRSPGRSPWTEADALVGFCAKGGSRGNHADRGVRPTKVRLS